MLAQFLSWFKPRMEDPIITLNKSLLKCMLDRNLYMEVECFLILFMTWAGVGDPKEKMERFKIMMITLYKMVEDTEHEFLKIEFRDKESGQTRFLLLDRTFSKQASTTTPDVSDLLADPSADLSADPPAHHLPNSRIVFSNNSKSSQLLLGQYFPRALCLPPLAWRRIHHPTHRSPLASPRTS